MTSHRAKLLLVEDPDKPLRSVQALARSLPEIESLDVRRSFDRALESLNEKSYEVILISNRFKATARIEFAKKARDQTEGGKDSALILVFQNEAAGSHLIASKIAQGTDGILQEPYSANQLLDAIQIAEKDKKAERFRSTKKAVEIALSDVMTYIEARTANPNITYNREISRRALSKLKETLSELESLDSDIYFEAIIEKFTSLASKERKLFEGGYRGASERVKKLMEKKAEKRVKEIAEEATKDEDES